MLPSVCVASTKPGAALVRGQGWGLGKDEGGVRRSEIAGQRRAGMSGGGTR
jgi:hypothetical protein